MNLLQSFTFLFMVLDRRCPDLDHLQIIDGFSMDWKTEEKVVTLSFAGRLDVDELSSFLYLLYRRGGDDGKFVLDRVHLIEVFTRKW